VSLVALLSAVVVASDVVLLAAFAFGLPSTDELEARSSEARIPNTGALIPS
jgi:hypothetical protein